MAAKKKKTKKQETLADQLKNPGTVLRNGDFAVVQAWERWHLLTVHSLNDNVMGIFTLHFMSPKEADEFLSECEGKAKVEYFDDVSKDFTAEVEAKLLPKADDYLRLVDAGYADMGTALTPDERQSLQDNAAARQQWLENLGQMMKEPGPGPYLRFEASHRKIRPAADFDALSRAAFAKGATIENQNALWTPTMKLKEWQFIARGEFPNVYPYCCSNEGIAGGKAMLKAFTDADRLMSFAKENGLTDAKGSVHILTMPPEGVIKAASQYEGMGVWGIHFNANRESDGYYAPLEQLQPIVDFLKQRGLV